MDKKTIRPCPLCTNHDAKLLHTQQFAIPSQVPLPPEYDIVCCHTCHFVFADTPHSTAQYENYYAHHAKYELATHSIEDDKRHHETADFLKKHLPLSAKIIDIGCANGDLLKKLKTQGYTHLTGIDPAASCTQYLAECDITPFNLTLSNIAMHLDDISTHDCVILSHIMEHLVEPDEMMHIIKKITQKNGLIYIEVPDASRYRDFFFKSFHYFDVEHINHFNQESLILLAKKHNLEIVETGEKVISVSPTVSVPAVFVLLKNTQAQCTKLKEAMQEYIQLSQKYQDKNIIEHLAHTQTPIVLWGVGSYAQNLFKTSALAMCNIIGIVDRDPNKQGLSILNKKIEKPQDFLKTINETTAILIASIPFADEISREIKEMGLTNTIWIA